MTSCGYLDRPDAGPGPARGLVRPVASGNGGASSHTEARDERLFRLHILPRFGSMPLVAITQYEVRVWVTHAIRQGLAASTVRRAYQLLGKVLGAAVDAGMIAQNPCRRVSLPRIERREMRFLTPVEVARLADSIRPGYRALVLLGAYGGLRISEMAGLRRSRVDLDQGMVEVVEIVTEVSGYLHFGPPKTRAGYRRVGLPRVVVEALAEQLSGSGSADDLVFVGPQGETLRLAGFRHRIWRPATRAAGLEGCASMPCAIRRWRCGSRPGRIPRRSPPGPGTPRSALP
jgi:integrase